MADRTLIKFIHEKVSCEITTRSEIKDHNCYAAGFSDGVIEALNDLKDFYLEIGEYERHV